MALFGRKNEQDATLGKPPMGWGVPGVQKDESVDPEMEAMLLTAPAAQAAAHRQSGDCGGNQHLERLQERQGQPGGARGPG